MNSVLTLSLKRTGYFKLFVCKSCVKRNFHQFKNTAPWNNILEFSDYLIESAVYYENGLLVLNKPYGVTFSRDSSFIKNNEKSKSEDPEDLVFKKKTKNETKHINKAYYTSGVVNDSLNLVDCLPYLKKHFRFDNLHISRVPEKYVSGVALLTTSKETFEHVNKCRLHSPTGKDKYLAVVVGVPRYQEGVIKLGFTLEEHPNKGKRVVLLQNWPSNAYKRGEVRIGTFHYRTISTGFDNLTSLIEIGVELRKYHAYRVFCADYLYAPVLGDNLYGSRVQSVMEVPMSINHFSDAADAPQKLPNEVYRLLGLTSGEASLIPVHVHLEEMLIPRFLQGGKPLTLRALPPPHFQWTCEKLGLKQPEMTRIEAV